ncbi:unnamed protein product [Dracunculus medinensis]|uniref:FANCI_HD2 domain-containing protein n=1 Tax=Dracunculus medinensis TaxID=318479 RepID=A0A158Q4U4_DRAME|nr:unnamed protein product [Dracunculus medinensis]
MSLPSTQSSQKLRSYANFCQQFCLQVERNMANGTTNCPKYISQVAKVVTQLVDDQRWNNFCNFAGKQCEYDGGELISKFVRNWFFAVEQLPDHSLNAFHMYQLVLELINIEYLAVDPSVVFHFHLNKELESFKDEQLLQLCNLIREKFNRGIPLPKRLVVFSIFLYFLVIVILILIYYAWLGAVVIIMNYLGQKASIINFEGKAIKGFQYRHSFLLQLLHDVLSIETFEKLIILIRNCLLDEILKEYVNELMARQIDSQIILKLIISSTVLANEIKEMIFLYLFKNINLPLVDLYPACMRIHYLCDSNPYFAKTILNILRRNRCLIICHIFALICLLTLCNISRFRLLSLIELKKVIVILRKHGKCLEDSAWMQAVMKNCESESLRRNLELLINIVEDIRWLPVVGEALKDIAFSIIADKSKADLRFVNGRIEEDTTIVNYAKRILLSLVENPKSIPNVINGIFTALTANPDRYSSAVLIDVVIELVLQHAVHLLNSWKSLRKIIDNICLLKEETAVWLVRALLPIIIQRPQLISAIVTQMRGNVLDEKRVATALPILLLILKSSIMRSSIRSNQFSQCFATFSTQALQELGVNACDSNAAVSMEVIAVLKRALFQPAPTKVLLYKGIVDASYSNENIIIPALDLLCAHLETLPDISRQSYIESVKTTTIVLEPLPELIQSVSILIRLSIHNMHNTSTQLIDGRESQVAEVISHLNKILEFVLENDIHDLQIDKLSDFSATPLGRSNIMFAHMIIAIYDALIEHSWHIEKVSALLRSRSELNEVLKEKMVKRKESKGAVNIPSSPSSFSLQLQTITSIVSRFIKKDKDEGDEANEQCLELLRSCAFDWVMEWSDRIARDLTRCVSNASLLSLTSFAKCMLLLFVGKNLVNQAVRFELWSRKSTQAIAAFSYSLSFIISKYNSKTMLSRAQTSILEIWQCVNDQMNNDQQISLNAAVPRLLRYLLIVLLPGILESYKDYEEHKASSDYIRQANALLMASRSLLHLIPFSNEKFIGNTERLLLVYVNKSVNFIVHLAEKSIIREIWNLLIYVARRGKCDNFYTNLLRRTAKEILETLAGDTSNAMRMESIKEFCLEICCEMLINACSASLSDIRMLLDITSCSAENSIVDNGICSAIEFCDRLAEVIFMILPIHVQYGLLKEQISSLLSSLYNTMNVMVFQLLSKHKLCNISEWKCLSKLATVTRGNVLRIMEIADEHVGTLNPLDQPNMSHQRKYAKALKDETIYVSYVRTREQFQANLLLLSTALHDDRLNVQVRNNAIGVRDFRIDADRLRQRMEEIENDNEDSGEDRSQPLIKRKRP